MVDYLLLYYIQALVMNLRSLDFQGGGVIADVGGPRSHQLEGRHEGMLELC